MVIRQFGYIAIDILGIWIIITIIMHYYISNCIIITILITNDLMVTINHEIWTYE